MQEAIGAEMKDFNHQTLSIQRVLEITQKDNPMIIREGMRFKNDELPENVLLDYFFSSPIWTVSLGNLHAFFRNIEE